MPRTPEAPMDPDAAPEHTLLGTVLGGRYRVVRVLGEGGVGVVYEAENTWTGRRVALKVLRPEYAAKREVVRRFKREAQAATRIDHPNIVDVLDMGEDRAHGTLYIVQELLLGTDLRGWLEHRGVPGPREAVEILTPVMAALIAAHRRGIIHRDIKPENIFLVRGPSGRVLPKLIDFGISKIVDATSPGPRTTSLGTSVGTPDYMSPEQARGDATLDGRSDVWSVGAVLYEMLCGRPPFAAPTHTLLLLRIVTERPVPVDEVNPAVPAHLAAIVHRALEPDASLRYPSMRALLADLVESPVFSSDGDGPALTAAQWDVLQSVPLHRDARRAETLVLVPEGARPSSPPGPRLTVLPVAVLAAAALLLLALSVPATARHASFAVLHAGMPVSISAALPAVCAPTPVVSSASVPAFVPPVTGSVLAVTATPVIHRRVRRAVRGHPPGAVVVAHARVPRAGAVQALAHPAVLRPLAAYPDE